MTTEHTPSTEEEKAGKWNYSLDFNVTSCLLFLMYKSTSVASWHTSLLPFVVLALQKKLIYNIPSLNWHILVSSLCCSHQLMFVKWCNTTWCHQYVCVSTLQSVRLSFRKHMIKSTQAIMLISFSHSCLSNPCTHLKIKTNEQTITFLILTKKGSISIL